MLALNGPPSLLNFSGYTLISASLGLALTLLLGAAWYYYWRVTREWRLNLSLLGHPRKFKLKQTVVICGGSIAGLMTARVCADHFQNVVIVDPDIKKAGQEFARKRVAQYDSAHAYLTFMVDGLRRLWANLDVMIEEAGGVFRPGDFQLHFGGIPTLSAQSSYPTITSKTAAGVEKTSSHPDVMLIRRPKFEAALYRLLICSSAKCIRTIQGTVRGLVPSCDMRTISSVDVRSTEGEDESVEDVALVIDCTGSTQAGFKWLKSAGFIPSSPRPAPDASRSKYQGGTDSDLRISYNPKLSYVTVTFQNFGDVVRDLPIPGGFAQAGPIYTYHAHFKWGNGGFIFIRTDYTIQLCCTGQGEICLPKESRDILPYMRSVKGARPPPQWVFKVVDMLLESEQRGDTTVTFKSLKLPTVSFVQYHKVAQSLPSNFIAIGDSEVQINPIFGQGCSKALYGAMILNYILHKSVPNSELSNLPENFGTLYFQRSHRVVEGLWTSVKALDYGYSTTIPVKGESRTKEGAITRWYSYNAYRAAETDEVVASALWHVRMLASPQVELFRPRVVWGVLRWVLVNAVVGS